MTSATHGGLVHSVLFYRTQRDYVECVVPLIAQWSECGEPVLVVLPEPKITLLRGALAATSEDFGAALVMTDITEVGRNPGRLLGMAGCFMRQHPGQRVLMIGEPVWPGRTGTEYPACVQHEALFNIALAGHEVTGLCLYDAAGLADSRLCDARRTHPLIWRDGSHHHNPEYAVDDALDYGNDPLPTSPAAVTFSVQRLSDLSAARQSASRYARLLGMCRDKIDDLQLIATELATNSLRHTRGACELAFWHHDGHLVCEARDIGQLDDPLAGRRSSQSGLFLVNAVADLVRTHISPAGTKIQAYLRLDRSAEQAGGRLTLAP